MFEIFLTFLKLGLTSFGGPVAHLGFFRDEFVVRKKWVSEEEYADLVALCQFLPGPASSQVGMAIGYYRGRIFGALLAWFAFTLPSAVLLILFGLSIGTFSSAMSRGWLHGLKIAAVAVVAQAVWEMGKKFCAQLITAILAIVTMISCLYFAGFASQITAIVLGAIVGGLFLKTAQTESHSPQKLRTQHGVSFLALLLFLLLLILLPLMTTHFESVTLFLANSFYRVGALVFGGGHVVLPLLQTSVVETGLISKDVFIAGYGAAQAIPGPLFSFSAYLGLMIDGYSGAIVSLVMIFLPSFLLVVGIIPYWEKLRTLSRMRSALMGVNAVVVGLLLSALCNPVWVSAIFGWKDVVLFLIAFTLLVFKKVPSYLVVLGLGFVTSLFGFF